MNNSQNKTKANANSQAKQDAIAKKNARKNYLNALKKGDLALADAIANTFGL